MEPSMTTHVDTTSAQTPAPSCDPELDRLLHPGRFYERPADVLVDAALSLSERRAILSAWASDACAVDSAPAMRHAPFASQPVTFDEIMDALVALDRPAAPPVEVWNRQSREARGGKGSGAQSKGRRRRRWLAASVENALGEPPTILQLAAL
jgi:hypothetical protein